MNSKEPTANKAKTKAKTKPAGHRTMTDIQKPKPGQAVAMPQSRIKATTKTKKATKRKPTAQLRAGKKVQALTSSAGASTAAPKATKASTYKEVVLGEIVQDAPKKAPSAEKVTEAQAASQANQAKTQTKKSDPAKIIADGSLSLSKTAPQKMKLSALRKLHFRPSQIAGAIAIFLLAIFFGRVAIWEHFYLIRMEGSERHVTNVIAEEPEIIEEEAWSEEKKTAYTVAADKPRFLTIPSIGVYNSPILEVGVKPNGEMATPLNIHNTGWYTGSSLPGTNGVSVMDGHGGPFSNAVFEYLPNLQVGAEIIIEMGDGRKFNYYVADLATKALGEEANNYMNTAFRSPERGRGALTLITCTGDWWLSGNTYSHRLFVRALLDESQSAAAPSINNATPPAASIPHVNTSTTVRPGGNSSSSHHTPSTSNPGQNQPSNDQPDAPATNPSQGDEDGEGDKTDDNTGGESGDSPSKPSEGESTDNPAPGTSDQPTQPGGTTDPANPTNPTDPVTPPAPATPETPADV